MRPVGICAIGLAALLCGCHARQSSKPDPALIQQGMQIFSSTPRFAHQYTGNQLSCSDCHIGGGMTDYASPLIDVAGLFPMYSQRAGHTITLANRIQECFVRSEAGRPPPESSPELRALVAYITSLSNGAPKGVAYAGRGLVKVPDLEGHVAAGRKLYTAQCAICHGANGAGVPNAYPAVWGDGSYNDGAGIDKPKNMAAFLIHNMPQNAPGTLKPQQAFDLAAFLAAQPRPRFNPAYSSY